jgi:RHS repeat-associated protein
MLPSTHSETHISISICTPENAYPRFYDAILSTKYFDDESELAYYGYRYYSPELGRFVSRDPAEEQGGLGLYVIAGNDILNEIDPFGLKVLWMMDKGFRDQQAWVNEGGDLLAEALANDPEAPREPILQAAILAYQQRIDATWRSVNTVLADVEAADGRIDFHLVKSIGDVRSLAAEAAEGDHIVIEVHAYGPRGEDAEAVGLFFGGQVDPEIDPRGPEEEMMMNGVGQYVPFGGENFEAAMRAYRGKCLTFMFLSCRLTEAVARSVKEWTNAVKVYYSTSARSRVPTSDTFWGFTFEYADPGDMMRRTGATYDPLSSLADMLVIE